MLNEVRVGKMSPETMALLRSLDRPLPVSRHALKATKLFPTRDSVRRANEDRLRALRSPRHVFKSIDHMPLHGGVDSLSPSDQNTRQKLLDDLLAPSLLTLKTGAQVMLVRNMRDYPHLVNGTVGRVKGFFQAQKERLREVVYPLKFDTPGVPVFNPHWGPLTEKKYPWVEFVTPEGKETVLVCPDEIKVEDSLGKCIVRRTQVPLVLSWAVSIHKSQGQTLVRVTVDLGRVFERGMWHILPFQQVSLISST